MERASGSEARVLISLRRYAEAEARLRQMLAADPEDAQAHALLAFALHHQDRLRPALREAEIAISLAPDGAYYHYIHALVLLAQGRTRVAQAAIGEALRLNPQAASYHALLSHIHIRQSRWHEALASAEKALELDPQDATSANLRALALVKLGRRQEADEALETALQLDPESAFSHANQGWALLDRGQVEGALLHFREALRIDPLDSWARAGIAEAVKARNPIYRLLLRYFLWMSRLSDDERAGTFYGIAYVRRVVMGIARQIPVLFIILLPFSLLYSLFIHLTWIGRPLFALLARFDRLGRLALPREEIRASNWVAACLLTALAGLALAASTGPLLWFTLEYEYSAFVSLGFLVLSFVGLHAIGHVATIFHCPPGGGRIALTVLAGLLALTGMLASLGVILGPLGTIIAAIPAAAYILGSVAFSWIGFLTILIARHRRRQQARR